MATKSNYFWTNQQADGSRLVGLNEEGRWQLGTVYFIDLPAVGTVLEQNGKFVSVEAANMVTNLESPQAGTIVAINEQLRNQPDDLSSGDPRKNWVVALK